MLLWFEQARYCATEILRLQISIRLYAHTCVHVFVCALMWRYACVFKHAHLCVYSNLWVSFAEINPSKIHLRHGKTGRNVRKMAGKVYGNSDLLGLFEVHRVFLESVFGEREKTQNAKLIINHACSASPLPDLVASCLSSCCHAISAQTFSKTRYRQIYVCI